MPAVLLACILVLGCATDEEASSAGLSDSAGMKTSDSVYPTTTLGEAENWVDESEAFEDIPPLNVSCVGVEDSVKRDNCFHNLALNVKNSSFCSGIGDLSIRLRCEAEVELNPDKCARIESLDQMNWCYRSMAFKLNDIEYCGKITSAKIQDDCIYNFVKYRKPNPYMCLDLRDLWMRDDCLMHHVDLGLVNPCLCVLIEDAALELKCNQTYIDPKIHDCTYR
ncbi:MAG TPA: hypothetical protein ENN13_03750 [Candidatus Altiarchaeales archaeon]|nr:hypothetical protein [Candidatus Altiarchaeales archaeon]